MLNPTQIADKVASAAFRFLPATEAIELGRSVTGLILAEEELEGETPPGSIIWTAVQRRRDNPRTYGEGWLTLVHPASLAVAVHEAWQACQQEAS